MADTANETGEQPTAPQAGRRVAIERGREYLYSTCPSGHQTKAPNKGLGRANVAAWETRHQQCGPTTA